MNVKKTGAFPYHTEQVAELSGKPRKNRPLAGQEELIKSMYQEGFSAYAIAGKLGVSPVAVYKKLKKQNVAIKRASILEIKKKKIISLYKKGYPIYQIAEKFDCCFETIKSLLKKERIPKVKSNPNFLKKKESKLLPLIPLAKKLYKRGLPYKEIEQKLGISRSALVFLVRSQKWKRSEVFRKRRVILPENLVIELYTQNCLPKTEIAKKVGCSAQTITKIIKKRNLKSGDFYLTEKIKALHQKGLQIPEIAKQIGCCKITVRKILTQQGGYYG